MNTITRGLMDAGHEVKLLTLVTDKHPFEIDELPKEYVKKTGIQGVYVDTKINFVDAFSALVTNDSYNISRFFSPDFDMLLTRLLEKHDFDIIHMESLFMTPYIHTCRRHSKAPILLRSHNLEYMIWERVAVGTKNRAKRSYLKYLSNKLKEYEFAVLPRLDAIVAISGDDMQHYVDIGYKGKLDWIPFGVDIARYPLSEKKPRPTVFHLGSMDWLPNMEGMSWFLLEVWPLVLQMKPDAEIFLAGRKMPEFIPGSEAKGVHVIGEVEDAQEFMNKHKVMVVPIHSAGGIRIKIIEGMALGKTIVSTRMGAEGIGYTDKQDIRVADVPQDFAHAIVEELEREDNAIGANARRLIEEIYDNQSITGKLVDFYQSLIT